MFRQLVHIVASVTVVLGIFGLGYAAWDGTSRARPAASVLQPAGTSTTPLKPHPARTTHPAIGETPAFLEARRMISPHLELELIQLEA